MFLTRLRLNPHHRDVQRCLGDSQALHRFVLRLFDVDGDRLVAEERRAARGVLHRLEVRDGGADVELLIQSRTPPTPSALPAQALVATDPAASTAPLDELLLRLVAGASFRFRLLGNPTRKIDTKSAADGMRRNGKRVPLCGDDARASWLLRHLEVAGMRLATDGDGCAWLRQRPIGLARGRRKGMSLAHEGHLFEGVVIISDADRARAALIAGIGPAKAYGFGLLSLAPL